MRSHVLLAPAVLLFVSAARAEEPTAVLERAVKVMGLDLDPAKRPAILLHFRGQGADAFRAEGTIHYGTDRARRLAMSVRKTGIYLVLTTTGGFMLAAHGIHDVNPSSIASRRKRPVFRHKSLFTNAGFVQSAVV